jgi:hypothetical protein
VSPNQAEVLRPDTLIKLAAELGMVRTSSPDSRNGSGRVTTANRQDMLNEHMRVVRIERMELALRESRDALIMDAFVQETSAWEMSVLQASARDTCEEPGSDGI